MTKVVDLLSGEGAYYNEIDPYAAAWLRNLIAAGHIAPGTVDERSIEDVRPEELAGYTQCHFFAGVGVWSYALRASGWPDHRRVWTGSCPCQPFSAAGKGDGFADERHLWPAFYHLISQCLPPEIYGEQVASKAVDPWIDLVHADMEALGYAFGSVPFPSAGVGAPHIRDRNYWVANSSHDRLQRRLSGGQDAQWGVVHGQARRHSATLRACEFCGYGFDVEKLGRYGCPNCEGRGLDDTVSHGRRERRNDHAKHDGEQLDAACPVGRLADPDIAQSRRTGDDGGEEGPRVSPWSDLDRRGTSGGLADDELQQRPDGQPRLCNVNDASRRLKGAAAPAGLCGNSRPGPTNGLWADADWLLCRDGKWRPVEPGTFPLAHGAASRVGRLRAYGNAVNFKAAQAWIESVNT